MKVIITGSTGMIGQLILNLCLQSDKITQVNNLVRKPIEKYHKKLNNIIINDFSTYDEHNTLFENIDMAFFCIGVYTGQVNTETFKQITVDYAVNFAKKLSQFSPKATFCLLSGAGADRTEKSNTNFARFKGMAENQISKLGLTFYAFRPAYIYPVTPRKDPNFMYRVTRLLYPLVKLFGDNASITSLQLGKAMFLVGVYGADKEILENKDIINYLEHSKLT